MSHRIALLFFLPIHVSFPPTKPGTIASIGWIDIVVSSYTPTISTLFWAQQRNKLKRFTFRMLAVGQPSIAGMTPLPGVTEEIAFIQKILGVEALTLDECNAIVDGVAATLPTCSWAHFACHGVQDPDKPMDSCLVMWDHHLRTLARLAQSSLASAEFAFPSFCESTKGSKQFPNEAMHLAAGLQFIGYRGVIGTMWSVGDKGALRVAMQIYGELFVPAGLLLPRQHLQLRYIRPFSSCEPIMLLLLARYHFFTLVYNGELVLVSAYQVAQPSRINLDLKISRCNIKYFQFYGAFIEIFSGSTKFFVSWSNKASK